MADEFLPEGFSLSPQGGGELPEGFTVGAPPKQAQGGLLPRADRPKGLGWVPNLVEVGQGLYQTATETLPKVAEAFAGKRPVAIGSGRLSGSVPEGTPGAVEPGEVAAAASLALPVGGVRTGPLPAAERYALRRAQFERTPHGETGIAKAQEMTAGRPVGAEEAGLRVKTGVREGLEEGREVIEGGRLLDQSAQGTLDTLVNLAKSTKDRDIQSLAAVKRNMLPDEWAEIQSATIGRLGQKGETPFDPQTWRANYGALSESGKRLLFTDKALVKHLDDIYRTSAAMMEAPTAREGSVFITNKSYTGGHPANRRDPIGLLAIATGGTKLMKHLLLISSAAAIARWSRSLFRATKRPGSATYSSFVAATKDLENNLGEDLDVDALIQGLQDDVTTGPVKVPPEATRGSLEENLVPSPDEPGPVVVGSPEEVQRLNAERQRRQLDRPRMLPLTP